MIDKIKSKVKSSKSNLDTYYQLASKYMGIGIFLYFLVFSLYFYYYNHFDIDTLAVMLVFTLIIGIFVLTSFYGPRVGIVMLIPPIYFVMITVIILYNPEKFISLGTALLGLLFVYGAGKIVMGLRITEERKEES